MYVHNSELYEIKKKDKKALIGMKEIEKDIDFHSEKINKNTIVYCKNKENIEKYKSLFKSK